MTEQQITKTKKISYANLLKQLKTDILVEITGKKINELPSIGTIDATSLFIIGDSNGISYQATQQQVKDSISSSAVFSNDYFQSV